MSSFIDETAKLNNSEVGSIKIYRNAIVNNCRFGDNCSIGDDTTIERSVFENNVIINRRSYINDSYIGKYTYAGINTTMNWTRIGRFCSLARNVDIGGFNHDYKKITTMPIFRFTQANNGGGKISQHVAHTEYCEIGSDVWIAAGAQILHKVKIGDGAVIGGGAVVTKNVPPYAIVVGVPARVIGYRFEEKYINKLLDIKWWNWPDDIIIREFSNIANNDVNDETINLLEEISRAI